MKKLSIKQEPENELLDSEPEGQIDTTPDSDGELPINSPPPKYERPDLLE